MAHVLPARFQIDEQGEPGGLGGFETRDGGFLHLRHGVPAFRTDTSASGASRLLSTAWPAELDTNWGAGIKEATGATSRTVFLRVFGEYPTISKRTMPALPRNPGALDSQAGMVLIGSPLPAPRQTTR